MYLCCGHWVSWRWSCSHALFLLICPQAPPLTPYTSFPLLVIPPLLCHLPVSALSYASWIATQLLQYLRTLAEFLCLRRFPVRHIKKSKAQPTMYHCSANRVIMWTATFTKVDAHEPWWIEIAPSSVSLFSDVMQCCFPHRASVKQSSLEEETINIIPAAQALIPFAVYNAKSAPLPPESHTGHKDE